MTDESGNVINLKVVCAKCLVPVVCDADDPEDEESIYRCPQCGVNDTKANVMAEVGDYVTDQAAGMIDENLENIARSNPFVSVDRFDRPDREYRFISRVEENGGIPE